MRAGPILASTAVLALSIVSTTFVLLALTSPDWSSQAYYYALNAGSDGRNQSTPLCTASRSPFYKCGIPTVDINGTCTVPACAFYKPYGANVTSCRTASEFDIDVVNDQGADGLLGGVQECQQVHYAGNLQIAASFFLTVGLCLALTLSLFTVILGFASPSEHAHHEADAPKESHHSHESRPQPSYKRSAATPYIVFTLLFCLSAGALLQLLAQYFAVLGLTISATPSGANAASYERRAELNNFAADDWVIDKALSSYATVAWTSALLCAAVSTSVFRTPRFPKLL